MGGEDMSLAPDAIYVVGIAGCGDHNIEEEGRS